MSTTNRANALMTATRKTANRNYDTNNHCSGNHHGGGDAN